MSNSSLEPQQTLPLTGVVVLDLTQVMLGPSCTQTLGDFGADVIKIERPGRGDLSREGVLAGIGQDNPIFLALNRNKRSIVVNLSEPAGREVVRDMVREADVIVNNFRPGVMRRLGLDYESLSKVNPRLIWASGTGFGPTGPYAHKGGQDILGQAYSGVMMRKADPSHPTTAYATPIADYTTGQHLIQGILLALLHRERTGVGQKVEVCLYDSMLALQMQEATTRLMYDRELNWSLMPLTGCFATADGQIVIIGAFKQNPLRAICSALGLTDYSQDSRFSDAEALETNRDEIRALIGRRLLDDTTAHWLEALESEDVLCGPVHTLSEALADPQTVHNEMVLKFPMPTGQTVKTIAPPVKMSRARVEVRHAPPALGEHSRELLEEFGYDSVTVGSLIEAAVVQ